MLSMPTRPISTPERIEVLDVLRGLAVSGILVFNIQYFSGNGFMPSALAHASGTSDQVTRFLIHFFVQGKFYSIFSLLFGFGFALQIARAEERDDPSASLFKRRLFLALIIFFFQILFSTLWLKHFSHGPTEWMWRRLTYRERLAPFPLASADSV